MRVQAIELRRMSLPFVETMAASYGSQGRKDCVLACVRTDQGDGYGECAALADPFYLDETTDTAWLIMNRYLAPMLLGQELRSVAEVQTLFNRVRGHHMAKAGLEVAVWDVFAKAAGLSLGSCLGASRSEIDVGVSLGLYAKESDLLQRVEQALEQGYVRIKVKIAPGQDVSVISAIRRQFGDIALSADANGAYTLADQQQLQRLDQFDLQMIEQPLAFDDFLDHATLAASLQTPICLDESIRCVADARLAISLQACAFLCIKYGRLGGLQAAQTVIAMCAQSQVTAWCGGMYETGVGRLANMALAATSGVAWPGDISPSGRYFKEDIIDPPVTFVSPGRLRLPTIAGIGANIQMDIVSRHTVAYERYAL